MHGTQGEDELLPDRFLVEPKDDQDQDQDQDQVQPARDGRAPFWEKAQQHASDPLIVSVRKDEFVDAEGRVVQLRGVNLGGNCKLPSSPDCSTHLANSLDKDARVSFVGRPFPLDEAHTHLARLRAFGFNCLRFLVTWEAIEHAGPGQYDHDYIRYVRSVLLVAAHYGFVIYIDPHQDVWSRFSGGDGAPLWTMEAVGLEVDNFEASGAALLHKNHPNADKTKFPKMLWPTNGLKFASCTMFTLFWAGAVVAPSKLVEGKNVQDFLQSHYIAALAALMEGLSDVPNVLGIGSMNEPLPGYLGWPSMEKLWKGCSLRNGFMPTPLQQMALASGIPQKVARYNRIGLRVGSKVLNREGVRAWKEGVECVWKQHGFWQLDERGRAVAKEPTVFGDYDFGTDFYLPFLLKFQAAMRQHHPRAMMFVELPPEPLHISTVPVIDLDQHPNIVNAAHWYDGMTLFLGRFLRRFNFDVETGRPVFGAKGVDRMMRRQLADMKRIGADRMGGAPTLIGECGIPFSLNDNVAYRRLHKLHTGKRNVVSESVKRIAESWGHKHREQELFGIHYEHTKAMNSTIKALEANCLSYTLWNYCPDHSATYGDLWNMEDLSIFSPELFTDHTDCYSGGRAVPAFVRPFPMRTAGHLRSSAFQLRTGVFRLSFDSDPEIGNAHPTVIFVPLIHFPSGLDVEVSDGEYEVVDYVGEERCKLLLYTHTNERTTHSLVLCRPQDS